MESVPTSTSLPLSRPSIPYKYFVLLCLYVAQAIPGSFFDKAVPVLLRQGGAPLEQIGLVKLLAIPVALKFLWAPLVDRYGSGPFGNYKSWIFPMQVITIVCTLGLALFDWVEHFSLFLIVGGVWALAAATQDVGVDGLAVRSLEPNERPTGVGIQNFAGFLGAIVGGGAMIILLDRVGLDNAIYLITFVLVWPLLALLPFIEPAAPEATRGVGFKTILTFFRSKSVGLWVGMIFLLTAGSGLSSTMVVPMLVDQGLELAKFGVLYGIIFPIVGGVGAIAAPVFIQRFGRRAVILGGAGFLCVDLLNLILIDQLEPRMWIVFAILAFGAFTNIFLIIGLSTVFMDMCRPESAATDWTVQMSVYALSGVLFGGLSGFVAQQLGYSGLFAIGLGLTILGIMMAIRYLGSEILSAPQADVP